MDIIDHTLFGGSNFWWFEGKRQFIVSLIEKFGRGNPQRILDAGCGTGDLLRPLKHSGKLCGFDNNFESLKIAKSETGELTCSSIDNIGLKSNSFDFVIVTDVLEHTKNDVQSLKEIARVTKPSGHILISVPAFSFLYSSHDIALQHYRRYDCPDLLRMIKACSLEIKYKTYWNFSVFPVLFFIRLLKKLFNHKQKLKKVLFPEWSNKLLNKIISLENRLIAAGFVPPFGLSIYLVLEKRSENEKT